MGRHSTAITPQVPIKSPSPNRKRKRDDVPIDELEIDIKAPEPPSKKALRKARKVKEVFEDGQNIEIPIRLKGGKEAENGVVVSEEGPDRSQYSVWIGNLSWSTTKSELRQFFLDNFGESDSAITRLHMPAHNHAASKSSSKSQNKGFAYVDFATEGFLVKALELTEKLFNGRKVLVKNAQDFQGRPDPKKAESTNGKQHEKPPSGRVFVGNLGFETSQADLQQHFEPCGEIESIHMATFEDSGKSKGYAWVVFTDLEAAEAAVRGWTLISPPQEVSDDSEDPDGKDNRAVTQDGKPKRKGQKPRKWWVNRFQGRSLRMEFAEGKEVRYKKRFGKKAMGRGREKETGAMNTSRAIIDEASVTASHSVDQENIEPNASTRAQARDESDRPPAPRLTGSIIESQGKKTTFS